MVYIYENFNIYTNYRFKEKIKEAIIYEVKFHLPKPAVETPKEIAPSGLLSTIKNYLRGKIRN